MNPLPILFILLLSLPTLAQTHTATLPHPIEKSGRYLFYLHGGVVTALGNNAVSPAMPEWGRYEYLNILDSLHKRGFNVISENRKESVDDSVYVNKIASQVDSLLQAGVRAENILVVGASAGAHIALAASAKVQHKDIRYAILGACWPETYKNYLAAKLYGRFISIIEVSDPHGTCSRIFKNRDETTFREITLHTGLSHGFIFKGYREWIDPITEWSGSSE